MLNNTLLKGFPYHPFKYNELWEKNKRYFEISREIYDKTQISKFISKGLLIDREFNVYVNPKYGAFFFDTNCFTIEEVIKDCEKTLDFTWNNIKISPVELAFLEYLKYLDYGYQFVIGPSVDLNDRMNNYGVYCSNYYEISKKLIKNQ